jgi:hypothetical protein
MLSVLLAALLAADTLNSFVNCRYRTARARLTRKKLPKTISNRKYTSTQGDTASCTKQTRQTGKKHIGTGQAGISKLVHLVHGPSKMYCRIHSHECTLCVLIRSAEAEHSCNWQPATKPTHLTCNAYIISTQPSVVRHWKIVTHAHTIVSKLDIP